MMIMATTMLLAKVFGIYLLFTGIAMALDPGRFRAMYSKMMSDDAAMMMGAVMALFIGGFVVATHNVWVWDWPVMITILGWWSVIKGASLMVWPGFKDLFRGMMDASDTVFQGMGGAGALLGLFFIYQGWM